MLLTIRIMLATLIALATPAWATQSFDYWLQQEVAPDLVKKFSHHPKFKGYDLAPPTADNRLVASITEQLSHELLANNAANILPAAAGPACFPANKRFYHLDVQTSKADSGSTRVHIRIKDPSSDVWLRGFSHSWQGRLTRTRHNQLRSSVAGSLGSTSKPASTANLADALSAQLSCADLPYGTFAIKTPNSDLGTQVREALADSLARPMNEANPDWIASVRLSGQESLTQGTVRLTASGDAQASQTIALFYLRTPAALVTHPTGTAKETWPPVRAELKPLPSTNAPWLSKLRVRKDRECKECVLATFKLLRTQDLLLFSTSNGKVNPFECSSPVQRRSPGDYKFRMRTKPSHIYKRRPTGGFYVLAGERQALDSVAQLFQQSGCQALPMTRLAELIAVTDQPSLRWQAIHFQKRGNTLVTL